MFKGQLKRQVNREEREEQEERQSRAKGFIKDFKIIRKRHRSDFQAYISLVDGGEGGTEPKMRIVDITEILKNEEKEDKLKEGTKRS